jgi:hypothetical protein
MGFAFSGTRESNLFVLAQAQYLCLVAPWPEPDSAFSTFATKISADLFQTDLCRSCLTMAAPPDLMGQLLRMMMQPQQQPQQPETDQSRKKYKTDEQAPISRSQTLLNQLGPKRLQGLIEVLHGDFDATATYKWPTESLLRLVFLLCGVPGNLELSCLRCANYAELNEKFATKLQPRYCRSVSAAEYQQMIATLTPLTEDKVRRLSDNCGWSPDWALSPRVLKASTATSATPALAGPSRLVPISDSSRGGLAAKYSVQDQIPVQRPLTAAVSPPNRCSAIRTARNFRFDTGWHFSCHGATQWTRKIILVR